MPAEPRAGRPAHSIFRSSEYAKTKRRQCCRTASEVDKVIV
jgi:hypothetical protein